MLPKLTDSQHQAIVAMLEEGDDEGAIETVFEFFPTLTRDAAVDIVNMVDKSRGKL